MYVFGLCHLPLSGLINTRKTRHSATMTKAIYPTTSVIQPYVLRAIRAFPLSNLNLDMAPQ